MLPKITNLDNVIPIEYLVATAVFLGAGYGLFDIIRGMQPVPPVVVSQAPAGCMSDLLADKLATGQKPVSRREYEDLQDECEKEAREARAMAQRADILQQQRDAMAVASRTAP